MCVCDDQQRLIKEEGGAAGEHNKFTAIIIQRLGEQEYVGSCARASVSGSYNHIFVYSK